MVAKTLADFTVGSGLHDKVPREFRKARSSSLLEEAFDLPHVEKQDKNQPRFVLLGIDIGHVSPTFQFVCSAFGVFAFLMIYGYLQEKIVVERFHRTLGMFITLLQFG